MKNSFGNAVTLTLFGESHGPAVGAVLDGIAPGIPVNEAEIAAAMARRRGGGVLSTSRREEDRVHFISGVYNGYTAGDSIAMVIENHNVRSADYAALQNLPRPGHADYAARQKYLGFEDPRGGGHFSGRITAPLVAAGALCRSILAEKGILIGTHLARCGGVSDAAFAGNEETLREQLQTLNARQLAVLDPNAGDAMTKAITAAAQGGDSVGGILETAVVGLPAGAGEPFFDSVESVLSHLLFSIPAVKGVEFGAGFAMADLPGSRANDAFCLRQGRVETQTNHNGGINGGVTNGMPVLLRTAIKPTPSIARPQQTVDLAAMQPAELQIKGRHDPCILPRARVVQDSAVALGLLDLLTQRYGVLWQKEGFSCGMD